MKNIIFLDLDGPMIPWWSMNDLEDDLGKNGKIIPGFKFLSRFHPEAVENLRRLCDESNSVIVTNSTHNGGANYYLDGDSPKYTEGYDHIRNVFKSNGVEDLLASPKDFGLPNTGPGFFMSGYKNRAADWRTKKDRALGVRYWFKDKNIHPSDLAYIALDDSVGDFQKYNSRFPGHTDGNIPYINVGPGHIVDGIKYYNTYEYLSEHDVFFALESLKSQAGYIPKK